jgi:bacillithiol system protein YtxJ
MGIFDKFMGSSKNQNLTKLNWKILNIDQQVQQILDLSHSKPVAIFKHSTRCSISIMAKDRLERAWKEEDNELVDIYYLDLISFRSISNLVSELSKVHHESPQLILFKNGAAIYDASHQEINLDDLKAEL